MPRQNRVTPDGTLIAVPDRGLFWGNRGSLHDPAGRLVRYSRGRAWAICVLEFKGRRRQLWAPGRLTELFFLDEATGLAAGHRPCGECRYRDYQAFKRAWAGAFGGGGPGVAEIDARLHADRLVRPGVRRCLFRSAVIAARRGDGLGRGHAVPGVGRRAAGLDAGRLPVFWPVSGRGHGDRHHAAGYRGRARGGLPAGHPPQRRLRGRLGSEPARDVEAERLAGDHGAQVGFQCGQPARAQRAGPPGPDVVEDHRGLR